MISIQLEKPEKSHAGFNKSAIPDVEAIASELHSEGLDKSLIAWNSWEEA